MKASKDSVILVSKDAFCKSYLPIYGNKIWKTPNIDELAQKGTVFHRHYTAAPSSAMSYFSMFTGKYAYETERTGYTHVKKPENNISLFDRVHEMGFNSHVIWEESWSLKVKPYVGCFGQYPSFHDLKGTKQPVGVHSYHKSLLPIDEDKVQKSLSTIRQTLETVVKEGGDKIFVWMHLPHVTNGRNGYGSDVDCFDEIIGIVRDYFNDNNIFITSDHGNMNGTHGKTAYGFDVYESAICIPLITPRIEGLNEVKFPTISCDLFDIIFNRAIPKHDFVYSDTAYYGQLHRKLAIICDNYKYIYNRQTGKEELYDVVYDPGENVNLITDRHFDTDRRLSCFTQELYYYDSWDEARMMRGKMRKEFQRIWRVGSTKQVFSAYLKHYGGIVRKQINTFFHL